ncbi:uncharacterized protein FTOL_11240 [Fusarium torulosum]|uniref:Uncharacterized protein n=1 Tax=Fusarium torulosum TaxID=33205 RepID=A0AAE8MI63_9HYPO|nr:uncharacterized protein FTOL_11240 [Fusarium torulosum]
MPLPESIRRARNTLTQKDLFTRPPERLVLAPLVLSDDIPTTLRSGSVGLPESNNSSKLTTHDLHLSIPGELAQTNKGRDTQPTTVNNTFHYNPVNNIQLNNSRNTVSNYEACSTEPLPQGDAQRIIPYLPVSLQRIPFLFRGLSFLLRHGPTISVIVFIILAWLIANRYISLTSAFKTLIFAAKQIAFIVTFGKYTPSTFSDEHPVFIVPTPVAPVMPSAAVPTILVEPQGLIQSISDFRALLRALDDIPNAALFGRDIDDIIQLASYIGQISEEYAAGINEFQTKLGKIILSIHSEAWKLKQSSIADAKTLQHPPSLLSIVLAIISRVGLCQPPDTPRLILLDRWLTYQDLLQSAKCQLTTLRQTLDKTSIKEYSKTLLVQNGKLRNMLQSLIKRMRQYDPKDIRQAIESIGTANSIAELIRERFQRSHSAMLSVQEAIEANSQGIEDAQGLVAVQIEGLRSGYRRGTEEEFINEGREKLGMVLGEWEKKRALFQKK